MFHCRRDISFSTGDYWLARWLALGNRDIAGLLDEASKLRVGDLVNIDPESRHCHAMGGCLLGIG